MRSVRQFDFRGATSKWWTLLRGFQTTSSSRFSPGTRREFSSASTLVGGQMAARHHSPSSSTRQPRRPTSSAPMIFWRSSGLEGSGLVNGKNAVAAAPEPDGTVDPLQHPRGRPRSYHDRDAPCSISGIYEYILEYIFQYIVFFIRKNFVKI